MRIAVLIFSILISTFVFGQKTKVRLKHADRAKGTKINGEDVNKLYGKVHLQKDDVDFYLPDISYDKNKKIVHVKIEVYLADKGPNDPYPFLEFKVDFLRGEYTLIDGISQITDIFTDIDDLKYQIEELIEKQY